MRVLWFLVLFAGVLFSQPLSFQKQDAPKQRDIRTKADFSDFITALEQPIRMGQINPYAYYLGLAYLSDYKLQDGVIKKDLDKAQKFFNLSLRHGNYVSAYQLALIALSRNEKGKALFVLDSSLEKLETSNEDPVKKESSRSFLATAFATIVLQYFSKDTEAVERAVALMEKLHLDEMPTAEFVLANLYKLQGKSEEANRLLDHACRNSKDARLSGLCMQFRAKRELP